MGVGIGHWYRTLGVASDRPGHDKDELSVALDRPGQDKDEHSVGNRHWALRHPRLSPVQVSLWMQALTLMQCFEWKLSEKVHLDLISVHVQCTAPEPCACPPLGLAPSLRFPGGRYACRGNTILE